MIWLLRIVWATLPLTAGPAAGGALDEWNAAPRLTAEVELWLAWAVVLVALLAPRPIGLTVTRVVAPCLFLAALVVAFADDAGAPVRAAATVATGVALVLVLGSTLSLVSANGVAYGDEVRFPLRTPPALFAGPLLLTPLAIGAGAAAAPILLAGGHFVAGPLALVVGVPVVAFLGRALHSLSRRWIVLVPAGLVVVDPITLADPVLFLRERIGGLRRLALGASVPDGVVDLRLGAQRGSFALALDRETELLFTRRGRRGAAQQKTSTLCFAAVRPSDLSASAAARRIRVDQAAASPPPTSASPS